MIDNRKGSYSDLTQEQVALICNRRFGIGADGLILIELQEGYDFKMVYYNSDGNESSMCGNGGRCTVAFAHLLGMVDKKCKFLAIDGDHEASVIEDVVALQMNVHGELIQNELGYFINTGSPHLLVQVDDLQSVDVSSEGRKLREHSIFKPGGSNINFMTLENDQVLMRTYERGVEDETLSCGTGVVAAALTAYELNPNLGKSIQVNTPGGVLKVSFEKDNSVYKNVILTGAATFVFEGKYLLHD